MKNNLIFILLITSLSLLSFGCGSDDCELVYTTPTNFSQSVLDDNIITIENYLQMNGLTAQKTASNLYYIIDEPGEANADGVILKPNLCSNVTANYVGSLPSGSQFDAGNGISFDLVSVINGWREGIPLFGKGGSGKLLIPSYLGYGMSGIPPRIPGNSVLIFDVTLVDFD